MNPDDLKSLEPSWRSVPNPPTRLRPEGGMEAQPCNFEPSAVSDIETSSLDEPPMSTEEVTAGEGGRSISHSFKIETRTTESGVRQFRVLDYLSSVADGIDGDSLTISGLANHLDAAAGWAGIGSGGLIVIEGSVSNSLAVSGLIVKKMDAGSFDGRIVLDENGNQTALRAIIGSVAVEDDVIEVKQGLMSALLVTHGFLNGSLVATFVHSEPHSIEFA